MMSTQSSNAQSHFSAQANQWVTFSLVFLISAGVTAQTPTGCFDYALGAGSLVYDISGSYDDEDLLDMDFDDVDLVQDRKGKVTGGGEFDLEIDDVTLVGTLSVKGKVKTTGTVHRVTLKIKIRGLATVPGESARFRATSTSRFEINTGLQTLSGVQSIKVCVSGLGCTKSTEAVDLSLPAGMDGTADLQICVNSPNDKKLLGTGTLTLANGRTANFLVKGAYSAKKDSSKISAKGDPNARGNKIKLMTRGTNMLLERLKAKLFGQKVFSQVATATSPLDLAKASR